MALNLYPVPGKDKSRLICKAFAAGAPADATGAVFFGTEGVMDAFQRAKTGTWFYCDNAYTDPQRQQYFRVAKNALQVSVIDRATGRMRESDGRRFSRLGITVREYRDKPGGTILVIPQSEAFMKSTLGRTGDWTRETVEKLRAWGIEESRIRVRPWLRDKKTAYVDLHKDLTGAALLVTWSSASAITALYEGIPAISESGAVNELSGPLSRDAVLQPPRHPTETRQRLLELLADAQFTLDEMRDGTAWRWINRESA